jgi:hypothetical protein
VKTSNFKICVMLYVWILHSPTIMWIYKWTHLYIYTYTYTYTHMWLMNLFWSRLCRWSISWPHTECTNEVSGGDEEENTDFNTNYIYNHIFFLTALEIELRASCLLGRRSYNLSHFTSHNTIFRVTLTQCWD